MGINRRRRIDGRPLDWLGGFAVKVGGGRCPLSVGQFLLLSSGLFSVSFWRGEEVGTSAVHIIKILRL